MSEGDARKALSALEIAVMTPRPDTNGQIRVTLGIAEESIQKKIFYMIKKVTSIIIQSLLL